MIDGQREPRVLYIAYWGAAEPLGQSLVLPAVKKLASRGAKLTLVTFEKPDDLRNISRMASIRSSLSEYGVRWIPLGYHKRPKLPATGFDFLHGVGRSILASLAEKPDIIHARTFIGGLMGMTLAPILAARLIYHNEGFYPDEQVDAGVWKAGSTPHRIAKRLEEKMYSRADAVIALSNRAKTIIENISAVRRKQTPVIKVPSCVDLDQFNGPLPDSPAEKDMLRFVYSGSIGGRYRFDDLARFISRASDRLGSLHLRVLTAADPLMVGATLSRSGLAQDAWSIECVAREAMPGLLLQQDVGLNFLKQGLSEHGCSPTKIGEYWAAGLPVITTANVSDTDEIIRRERVGVIVREHTDESYDQAIEELRALLLDPELRDRCRKAALMHYALEPACERQFALYKQLASNPRSAESRFLRSAASITDER